MKSLALWGSYSWYLFTPSILEFSAAEKGLGRKPGGERARLYLASSIPSVMRKEGPKPQLLQETRFGDNLVHSWAQPDRLWGWAVYRCLALLHTSRAWQVSPGTGRDLEPFPHTSCQLPGLAVPRDADRTSSALGSYTHTADSQGMAAPRDGHDLLGQKWYLSWAWPLGSQTGREWNRKETCLLTAWPYSLSSPSCFSFYFGLALSSNK